MTITKAELAAEVERLTKALERARRKNRTLRKSLGEAFEREQATAGILRVISRSPTDLKPVFDAILENATRLSGAEFATLGVYDGEKYEYAAQRGGSPEIIERLFRGPFVPPPGSNLWRTLNAQEPLLIADVTKTQHVSGSPGAFRDSGVKTLLSVPMLKQGRPIGSMTIYRLEVRPFDRKQIDLIATLADQAVIAIENVRLFKELEARNADLTEALEQQTATSEILRVISSSPTDLTPVFDAILDNATRLCDAQFATVGLYDGDEFQYVAQRGGDAEFTKQLVARGRFVPAPGTNVWRMITERRAIHVEDLVTNRQVRSSVPVMLNSGARTIVAVPMFKEGKVIGGINVYRREVRAFSQKQIGLVSTFANQAVIAIENVRLFKELQAQTEALSRSVEQLEALGEVGQAIGSSLELETVLKTIVSRALQLTGLDAGSIYEFDAEAQLFRLQATENMPEEITEAVRNAPNRLGEGVVGRTGITREIGQVADILDPAYQSGRRDLLLRAGYRALLAVPLMREDQLLGVLLVNRKSPGAFPRETVDLLKTFATQSAVAIQNARLFREIAEKSRQLEIASQHKSQFLASMSHELRTPLNAMLGFNEMILGDIYGPVPDEMRDPLTDIQSSGRHLLRLINNVLDLAKIEAGRMELSLADYSVHDTVESVRSTLHPLAAEKGLEFTVSIPQDLPFAHGDFGRITQCLMNLAGNALKFTRSGSVRIAVDLNGDTLTYRVIDTGIGIAADKIGSLFTEFRQSDAAIASEFGGTGLGLSITRKFVEMHGGRIWVESEPGKGSAFVFEVPLRAAEGEDA